MGTGSSVGGVDLLVVLAFFAVMIGVGAFYARRQKSSRQFFGSDKTVPWYLAGVSIYMNSFSALAFVMYSALAYKYGLVPMTICWVSVPALLLGMWLVALKLRRSADAGPLDFISSRFGPKMNQAIVWLGIPMQVLDCAFKLLAIGTVTGLVIRTALPEGVSLDTVLGFAIVGSGVVIVAYTFLGGLKAAVVCDFIQFFVILAVVLVLPPLCLERLAALDGGSGWAHGWQVFTARAPESFRRLTAGIYDWEYMFFAFLLVWLNLSTTWSLIQRYASTRSEGDAKRTGWLAAVLQAVSTPVFFFPAMAARVFIPDLDLESADAMNGVYATLCLAVLPCGMVGLMIAAMFSATMSTLAGTYNAISNVFTSDIYRRFRRDASDRSLVTVGRIATAVIGLVVIAMTAYMRAQQGKSDLFDLSNRMFSVFLPPISISMLAGLFARRASRRAGLAGLGLGIGTGFTAFVLSMNGFPRLSEVAPMTTLTSVATIAGLVLGTFVFRDAPEDVAARQAFYRRLDTPAE